MINDERFYGIFIGRVASYAYPGPVELMDPRLAHS